VQLENQGLSAVAFFEATAFIILLVLFVLLRKDHPTRFLNIWIVGWALLTVKAVFELTQFAFAAPPTRLLRVLLLVAVNLLFLKAVLRHSNGPRATLSFLWPAALAVLLGAFYFETHLTRTFGQIGWFSAAVLALCPLVAGWCLWHPRHKTKGHGTRLLGGLFFLLGLHSLDRALWLESPFYLLRLAFDHLLLVAVGIAMVVVVLEAARTRTEELNDKLSRLSLLIAASTQTLSVREMLDRVLGNVVESLGVSHGIVRLLEGEGQGAHLVVHAAVGFDARYLAAQNEISASQPWAQRVLREEYQAMKIAEET